MSIKRNLRNKRKTNRKQKKIRSQSIFHDLPELQKARGLWAEMKWVESAALFDQIVRQHPANIPALIDASRAFGSLYQYPRAEQLLGSVKELGARSANSLHLAGQSYRLMRRMDQANQCFLAALKLNPSLADSHLELAISYERTGDLDATMHHCRSRLQLLPGDGESQFIQGRILRRTKDFERAAETLLRTSKNAKVHALTRARCLAELAKLHDQQQQYSAAWAAIMESKAILRQQSLTHRQHRQQLVPPLQKLIQQVSAAEMARWSEQAMTLPAPKPRPVLLSGLPRSGTTLLGQILGAHPDIVTADEFDLFPRLIFPILLSGRAPREITLDFMVTKTSQEIQSLRNTHHDLFQFALPESADARLLVDKNPSLLPLLAPYWRVFPNDKLVIMLRDPRDVLISCMMAYMPLNDFSVDFLDLSSAALRIESDLQNWICFREKMPAGSWFEIRYESLVHDFRNQVALLLDYLDLGWSDKVLDHVGQTGSMSVFSPSYTEVAQPVYTHAIGRWQYYRDQIETELPRLQSMAQQLGY